MLSLLFFFVPGLAFLIFGAEILVKGSTSLQYGHLDAQFRRRNSNGILIQLFAQVVVHVATHNVLRGRVKTARDSGKGGAVVRNRSRLRFARESSLPVFDADFHDHASPSSTLQPNVKAACPLEFHIVGVHAGHEKLSRGEHGILKCTHRVNAHPRGTQL